MVKMYSLNLSSVGKRLKKCMQQVLGKTDFFNICDYFEKYVKSTEIQLHISSLGEGPTKITITNASIDKQITLKRDNIYKIENTDLEIGVFGVLIRTLFNFEADWLSIQCMRYASTF